MRQVRTETAKLVDTLYPVVQQPIGAAVSTKYNQLPKGIIRSAVSLPYFVEVENSEGSRIAAPIMRQSPVDCGEICSCICPSAVHHRDLRAFRQV